MFKFKHATKKIAELAAPVSTIGATVSVITATLNEGLLTAAVIKAR